MLSQPQKTLAQIDENMALRYIDAVVKKQDVQKKVTFFDFSITDKYFEHIKKNLLPNTEEYFIISGMHWYSGVVRRLENNSYEIFLFDPIVSFHATFLLFIEPVFSNVTLDFYYNENILQNAEKGCRVMSLDIWKRMHKIGKYLPEKYQGDLLAYLRENVSDVEQNNGTIGVRRFQLPLYMMKSMQSRSLLSQVIPTRSEENNLSINKNGELPLIACQRTFENGRNQKNIEKSTKIEKKANANIETSDFSKYIFKPE